MSTLDQTRPDLEDLAAFVDGRLAGELRQPVEERLARDPAYYEVFLETLRFREENEAVASLAERRRVSFVRPALAAAAVVVMAVGVWWLASPSAGTVRLALLDAERIVKMEGWDSLDWIVLRGDTRLLSNLSPEQKAFRLGVRSVDFRVALAAGDLAEAEPALGQLKSLVRALGLFGVVRRLAAAEEAMSGGLVSDLENHADDIEASLREVFDGKSEEGLGFTLGRWTQATRLAALSEDRRAFADYLARAPHLDHRPEIAAALARLEEVAKEIDSPDGWSRAVAQLNALAKAFGG